jgi:uncharacterized membrane protein YadS
MLEVGPVFLLNADTNVIKRLGVFATRRFQGRTADEAGTIACRMTVNAMAAIGLKIHLSILQKCGLQEW